MSEPTRVRKRSRMRPMRTLIIGYTLTAVTGGAVSGWLWHLLVSLPTYLTSDDGSVQITERAQGEVEVVMDDQKIADGQLVETQQWRDSFSGLVHEGHRFYENELAFGIPTFADHGFKFQAFHLDAAGIGKLVNREEAKIVAGVAVCRSRVAQPNDHYWEILVDIFHAASIFAILYFNTD